MNMKSLLRETLNSYRESYKSVIGSRTFAAERVINAGYPASEAAFPTFIAPSDGVLVVQALSSDGAKGLAIRIKGVANDAFNVSSSESAYLCGNVPCKKGDTIGFYILGTNAKQHAYLRFYAYIGSQS